jgi:hypothetical protein
MDLQGPGRIVHAPIIIISIIIIIVIIIIGMLCSVNTCITQTIRQLRHTRSLYCVLTVQTHVHMYTHYVHHK